MQFNPRFKLCYEKQFILPKTMLATLKVKKNFGFKNKN